LILNIVIFIMIHCFWDCMKLLTFDGGKGSSLGALIEDKVLDLNAAFEMGLGGDNGGLDGKRLDMLSFLDLGEEGVGQAQKAWTEARRILDEGGGSPDLGRI
jgi:hypothetical protein